MKLPLLTTARPKQAGWMGPLPNRGVRSADKNPYVGVAGAGGPTGEWCPQLLLLKEIVWLCGSTISCSSWSTLCMARRGSVRCAGRNRSRRT